MVIIIIIAVDYTPIAGTQVFLKYGCDCPHPVTSTF